MSIFYLKLACGKSFQCEFSTGICLVGIIHIYSMIFYESVLFLKFALQRGNFLVLTRLIKQWV